MWRPRIGSHDSCQDVPQLASSPGRWKSLPQKSTTVIEIALTGIIALLTAIFVSQVLMIFHGLSVVMRGVGLCKELRTCLLSCALEPLALGRRPWVPV